MANNYSEEILDSSNIKKPNDSIDFDLKLVRGMSLTYFIYGLFYYLEVSAFLVPLPMAYYMLPIVAVIMYVRSANNWKSIILLFIPILVLKDLWINVNPIVMEPLLFASIMVWVLWGFFFFVLKDQRNLEYGRLAGLSQFLIFTILIPGHWIIFPLSVLLSLGMLTVFVRKNLENQKATVVLRISLLIQMMYAMYLLQVFSNFQNT
jgi:hypothetical protein